MSEHGRSTNSFLTENLRIVYQFPHSDALHGDESRRGVHHTEPRSVMNHLIYGFVLFCKIHERIFDPKKNGKFLTEKDGCFDYEK